MLRIYIKRKDEKFGHVFKSRRSILNDCVSLLAFSFVLKGLVPESEWSNNTETIIKRFNLYVSESKFDGRKKIARSVKYFTWGKVLEPSPSKRMYL